MSKEDGDDVCDCEAYDLFGKHEVRYRVSGGPDAAWTCVHMRTWCGVEALGDFTCTGCGLRFYRRSDVETHVAVCPKARGARGR